MINYFFNSQQVTFASYVDVPLARHAMFSTQEYVTSQENASSGCVTFEVAAI